jgi:HNH endonuclease
MASMSSFRVFVTQRAGNRCEYCGLSQLGQEATFHIDHVIPVAADGPTESSNFALACVSCSLSKSARLSAIDPETQTSVPIFNPRQQRWSEHFRWDDVEVIGLTAIGRATIVALRMNRPVILAIRAEEKLLGRHPPITPAIEG